MDITVFGIVMLAALLHATWNAIVKNGNDKTFGMTAVVIGQALVALPALAFVPSPDFVSWPYLAFGVLLHIGYQSFLLRAYKTGEFTQVYPIARGTAPIIVAVVSVVVLGAVFSPIQIAAISTIGAGIVSLCLVRANDGLRDTGVIANSLITACFIAGYSLVDGYGARQAGTSVGFYAWEAILNTLIFVPVIAFSNPGMVLKIARNGKFITLFGGGASFLAYALVVWSFTQAPIALVTALRETSIVFALFIGVFFLKEKLDVRKVISTFVTVFGAALLKLAR